MRRSPVAPLIVGAAILLIGSLAGCGSDDGAEPSRTTAASTIPLDAGAEELLVCAPLASIDGLFTNARLEELASGSEAGQLAAGATLDTALGLVEDAAGEAGPDVTQAIETLRDAEFGPTEEGPSPEEARAAAATLVAELGGPCGDFGG